MRPVELVISDERLQLEEASLARCIEALDACPGIRVPSGSIEVAFVDEPTCSRLHEAFFDDPEITDVMTFPGDPEDGHAGDIAICPVVARSASRETGLPFHEELTLYLVHACLHLAGFNDKSESDIKEMRALETRVMDHLRIREAFLSATWEA